MRTKIVSHLGGRQLAARGALAMTDAQVVAVTDEQLAALGIGFAGGVHTFDAALVGPAIGNLGTPVQFLQNWLPGVVRQVTNIRVIDELVGVTVGGSWEDEEFVQRAGELTAQPELYGDASNIPLSNYNITYERRTIVRFEQGMVVGRLEEARMAKGDINTAVEKRAAVSNALDILRNRVGFLGYNAPDTRTYGFLNDPLLPAYVNVPAGDNGMSWSGKTFAEITADIRTMVVALVTSSGGNFRPAANDFTIALPLGYEEYLGVTGDLGYSVQDWFTKTYPRGRFTTAPELVGANGGANVAYIYAETIEDGSTDDRQVVIQMVPARFQALGTEQKAKGYVEDYTNATAGVMWKRPFAVRRYSGL